MTSTIQRPKLRIDPIPPHEFAKLTVNEKMKRIRVIKEFDDTLLIDINGDCENIANSPYYNLKYVENYGGQIEWVFTPDGLNKVIETFNPGIYNCWLKGKVIQVEEAPRSAHTLRDDEEALPGIARSIIDRDFKMFRTVVNEWRSVIAQQETIEMLLAQFTRESADGRAPRVVIEKGRFIIDERFMVNEKGAANYMHRGQWCNLCLVAPAAMKSRTIRTQKNDDVTLNSVTNLILAKVMFCLYPSKDSVFLQQLPSELRSDVVAEIEGKKVR